jgi:hypothetical protein
VSEREVIVAAMKESAPGEDGVRIGLIRRAHEGVRDRVIELVTEMFEKRADAWDESLKIGIMIQLYKKGDRNDCNNKRGYVCQVWGA